MFSFRSQSTPRLKCLITSKLKNRMGPGCAVNHLRHDGLFPIALRGLARQQISLRQAKSKLINFCLAKLDYKLVDIPAWRFDGWRKTPDTNVSGCSIISSPPGGAAIVKKKKKIRRGTQWQTFLVLTQPLAFWLLVGKILFVLAMVFFFSRNCR